MTRIARGFTLIELLATIAVIAVLTGIALSAVSRVRAGAGAARCAGNLRALHFTMNQYANDGGYWPSVNINSTSSASAEGTVDWFISLIRLGYLETKRRRIDERDCLVAEVFSCPANMQLENEPYLYTSAPYPIRPNYALNVYWGERGVGRSRVQLAEAVNPHAVLLLDTYNSYGSLYATSNSHLDWASSGCRIPRDLHSGGVLAVTGAGSVINLSPSSTPDITDKRYWDPLLK